MKLTFFSAVIIFVTGYYLGYAEAKVEAFELESKKKGLKNV